MYKCTRIIYTQNNLNYYQFTNQLSIYYIFASNNYYVCRPIFYLIRMHQVDSHKSPYLRYQGLMDNRI